MATVHDLLINYQNAQTALDAAKADQITKRQAATDADATVVADETAVTTSAEAVKTGLTSAGASFIVKEDGTPQVEPDGTIQIFEPDATTNGWHVTIAKPSNINIA